MCKSKDRPNHSPSVNAFESTTAASITTAAVLASTSPSSSSLSSPAPAPAPAAEAVADGDQEKLLYFVRILGNVIPGRHDSDFSETNLEFMLRREPRLAGVQRGWLINRQLNGTHASRLRSLLKKYAPDDAVEELPFDIDHYRSLPLDLGAARRLLAQLDALPAAHPTLRRWHAMSSSARALALLHILFQHKNVYAMNSNNARNRAIEMGRERGFRWSMPLDGECFFSEQSLRRLRDTIMVEAEEKGVDYLVIPMNRLFVSNEVLYQRLRREPGAVDSLLKEQAAESAEPQIALRHSAPFIFNETVPYGDRDKLSLFWRLDIKGPWTPVWPQPWERERDAPLSGISYATAHSSPVARLSSGNPSLDSNLRDRMSVRQIGTIKLLAQHHLPRSASSDEDISSFLETLMTKIFQ